MHKIIFGILLALFFIHESLFVSKALDPLYLFKNKNLPNSKVLIHIFSKQEPVLIPNMI